MLGYHTPQQQTPLARQTPLWQSRSPWQSRLPWQGRSPWQGRPPLARRPSWQEDPLHSACWEIRSTCRWYASYWNAILVSVIFWLIFIVQVHSITLLTISFLKSCKLKVEVTPVDLGFTYFRGTRYKPLLLLVTAFISYNIKTNAVMVVFCFEM